MHHSKQILGCFLSNHSRPKSLRSALRIATSGRVWLFEDAQRILFEISANQIWQTWLWACADWREVRESRTSGVGPSQSQRSRFFVLTKRSGPLATYALLKLFFDFRPALFPTKKPESWRNKSDHIRPCEPNIKEPMKTRSSRRKARAISLVLYLIGWVALVTLVLWMNERTNEWKLYYCVKSI